MLRSLTTLGIVIGRKKLNTNVVNLQSLTKETIGKSQLSNAKKGEVIKPIYWNYNQGIYD